jgi:hypothetical protein
VHLHEWIRTDDEMIHMSMCSTRCSSTLCGGRTERTLPNWCCSVCSCLLLHPRPTGNSSISQQYLPTYLRSCSLGGNNWTGTRGAVLPKVNTSLARQWTRRRTTNPCVCAHTPYLARYVPTVPRSVVDRQTPAYLRTASTPCHACQFFWLTTARGTASTPSLSSRPPAHHCVFIRSPREHACFRFVVIPAGDVITTTFSAANYFSTPKAIRSQRVTTKEYRGQASFEIRVERAEARVRARKGKRQSVRGDYDHCRRAMVIRCPAE